MEFDEEKILEQLHLILRDKNFSRSKIYGRLLRFLVQSSIEGKEIKEVIIGTELFGNNYDPIKYDNKVRVYVYHLRKKLDEYYLNSAQKDELIFTIEKGQYHVKFSKKADAQETNSRLKKKLIIPFSILLIALIFLFILLEKKDTNLYWKETIQNNFPTTILYGDFFTITGPISTERNGMFRDFNINSRNDLDQYIKKHPERATELEASPQPYLGGHTPYCTHTMGQFFYKNKVDFNINLMSQWDEGNFQQENIVYFGAAKCMGVLEKVVADAYPQFEFLPQSILRTNQLSGEVTEYRDVISYVDKISDYTVVGKVTMPAGNQISFFFSDQDCGVVSAIKYFTQNDSVQSFYKRHQIKDEDFIALYNITGWQRKGFEMEFLLLDKREP